MPPAVKQQIPTKRPIDKQEPDMDKPFTVKAHAQGIENMTRWLHENEKYYHQVQEAKAKIKQKTATIHDLQSRIARLNASIDTKDQMLKSYAESNGNLKADLINQQPTNQMADSQIVEQYNLLRENISSWVDIEVRRFEDHWKIDHDGHYPDANVFRDDGNPAYTGFLAAYPKYGGEYLVESEVHSQLHENLFDKNTLFVTLDKSETMFVQTVEDGLTKTDTPRDSLNIRYLRSEILKGFASSDIFQERRTRWMSETGAVILRSAETLLPELYNKNDPERKETFQRRVLEPAFDLAVAMRNSSTSYEFTERMAREIQFKNLPMRVYHWEYCTMINIDTRQEFKKQGRIRSGDRLTGAHQVLLLAPGLIRSDDRTGPRMLTTDTVCVKVDPLAVLDGVEDGDVAIKKANRGSGFEDEMGGIVSEPPMKKQKGRSSTDPIVVYSLEGMKTERLPNRQQRARKPPKIYGLHPDSSAAALD